MSWFKKIKSVFKREPSKQIQPSTPYVAPTPRRRISRTNIEIITASAHVDFKEESRYDENQIPERYTHHINRSGSFYGTATPKRVEKKIAAYFEDVHGLHWKNRSKIKASKVSALMNIDGEQYKYKYGKLQKVSKD